MAGHSLGEITALVAAEAIDAPDGLCLVAARGRLMQEARGGGMVAVRVREREPVEQVAAETGLTIANDNAPDQLVLSGSLDALDRAEELLRERKVRAKRLPVGGAFHSPLMEPAAVRLRPALAAWYPDPPDPPFLSTTTCALEPPERMREVLLAQLTAPVRFGDAVAAALDAGADRFVEIGPGRVLSGLVRRVRRDTAVSQVGEPADVEAIAA
jgi:malonyl CoA-acyl carrier protein transacylase